jgi:hypothetical protein
MKRNINTNIDRRETEAEQAHLDHCALFEQTIDHPK